MKGRQLGVRGEGLVVEERGRGVVKREGESQREAESTEGRGGKLDWLQRQAG